MGAFRREIPLLWDFSALYLKMSRYVRYLERIRERMRHAGSADSGNRGDSSDSW
jgi:hypothetical protein